MRAAEPVAFLLRLTRRHQPTGLEGVVRHGECRKWITLVGEDAAEVRYVEAGIGYVRIENVRDPKLGIRYSE